MNSRKKIGLKTFFLPYTLFLIFFSIESCGVSKKINYFQDLPDSSTVTLPPLPNIERTIQIGDRLQITFGSLNPESSSIFNTYGGISTSGAGNVGGSNMVNNDIVGYFVDADGTLEFPKLGRIYVSGKTSDELREDLKTKVSVYLRDPVVNVKFINFKFTVLGDVRTPGTYNLPVQRTNLLDALGAAGDLPTSAQRYDILLYRDYSNRRTITKIDLRNKQILYDTTSFILRHNDVLYVKTRRARSFQEEFRVYGSVVSIALGVTLLIVNIIK